MIWAVIAACYVAAAAAFYTIAAKTATPQVELSVVEGGSESHSKAA